MDRHPSLVGLGLLALAIPTIYWFSELLETMQGGDFTTFRLVLTYVGEAGLPFVVLGLAAAAVERGLGAMGMWGAVLYSYAFVFFTCTVVYAIADHITTWSTVRDRFGIWLTLHGAVMVVGGLLLGGEIVRSHQLRSWIGLCLGIGVVAVAATTTGPSVVRTLTAALPMLALVALAVDILWVDRTEA